MDIVIKLTKAERDRADAALGDAAAYTKAKLISAVKHYEKNAARDAVGTTPYLGK
jgi:N-acetylmuramic acid 6-phosphate (MurNAc-6-P) etherase|tara:strand:+ start:100 stop:264 length:165 start_codon:yes stop_codon:yes gene_type:complete